MGEAFLRKYGGEHFQAYSAGLVPKELIQILITVCDDAEKNCPNVWPGVNQRLHWSFEAPAAFEGTQVEKLEKFRDIRGQIERRIQQWLSEQGTLYGN